MQPSSAIASSALANCAGESSQTPHQHTKLPLLVKTRATGEAKIIPLFTVSLIVYKSPHIQPNVLTGTPLVLAKLTLQFERSSASSIFSGRKVHFSDCHSTLVTQPKGTSFRSENTRVHHTIHSVLQYQQYSTFCAHMKRIHVFLLKLK